jgi:hypothetical protein
VSVNDWQSGNIIYVDSKAADRRVILSKQIPWDIIEQRYAVKNIDDKNDNSSDNDTPKTQAYESGESNDSGPTSHKGKRNLASPMPGKKFSQCLTA